MPRQLHTRPGGRLLSGCQQRPRPQQLAGVAGPILLDLSQVEFIDCFGLTVLLAEQSRRATALRIVATSRAVDRLLEIARLELTTAPLLESVS